MSCEGCRAAQEEGAHTYPYRWKNANILVMGCIEHIREVFRALSLAQGIPQEAGDIS